MEYLLIIILKFIYNTYLVNYKITHLLYQTINNCVTSFLKRIQHSKFFCLFKDGFNYAINIASRFLGISVFLEAWHKTFQVKTWLICLLKCLAFSESLLGLSCSKLLNMVLIEFILKLPFYQKQEIKSEHFLKKFHHFTKNNVGNHLVNKKK